MITRWSQFAPACATFYHNNWYCTKVVFWCVRSGNSCLSKENNLPWLGQGDASVWMRICSTFRVGQPIPSLSSRNGQTPSGNRLIFDFNFIVTTACSDAAFACYAPQPDPAPPPLGKKRSSVHHIARSPHLERQLNPRGHFGEIKAPKDFSSSKI
jgi:hypothetical protein